MTNDATDDFTPTDLTELLKGPSAAETRKALLARLDALLVDVNIQLSKGLSPENYEDFDKIRSALETSRKLVLTVSSR